MFGKNHETKSSDRVKLLDFSPCKPDNMQSYICVRSLVQLDAYKKVSIVHGTKQREGWELKKWQMWKREIDEVEDAWRNVYEVERNSVALPRHLGIVAKEVLLRLPDEVIRQRITAEVDQILQHLPDCPDQHLRSLRRLNWVEWKSDSEKLSVRIDGAKDRAKASKQAHNNILWALSNVRDHLQWQKKLYDGSFNSEMNSSVSTKGCSLFLTCSDMHLYFYADNILQKNFEIEPNVYVRAAIVRRPKRQGGWRLKKWKVWENEFSRIQELWMRIHRIEHEMLLMIMAFKKVSKRLPDEVIWQRKSLELDQICQRLPDFPDQNPMPLRRPNWVGKMQILEALEVRVARLEDTSKAFRQAQHDIVQMLKSYELPYCQWK